MPKILLAIDAFSPLDRLLPAAVLLASQQHAELLVVFSQDDRVLRGAALSCTQEVGASSAVTYPVTSTSVEQRMKRIADDVQRRLSQAAELRHLRWEFQQCSRSISQITTEADAEIVLPGWRESRWVSPEKLQLTTPGISTKPVVIVIDDATSASAEAIEAARGLSGANRSNRLIILGLHAAMSSRSYRQKISVGDSSAESRIPVASVDQLVRQLQWLRPTLTMLGCEQFASADNQLHQALTGMKCPVALVRKAR